jgi:molybdate transport system substrate-binding protein
MIFSRKNNRLRKLCYCGLIAITLTIAIAFSQITNLSPATAQQPETITLTVSAGAGLKPVLEQIKQAYNQSQPNVNITYNFAASGTLARQIEQGAKIDVFISASTEHLTALKNKGFILVNSHRNLLKNSIALIVPKKSTAINSFQDLTKPSVKKIAVGEPRSVPVGKSAQEIFNYFGIFEQVKPKLVYTRNAPQILNYVENGMVDAGITHDSNAQQSNQVKIVVLPPEKAYTPLVYPVAILKDSKNISVANEFINFLFSNPAKELFKKFGYKMAN